MRSVSTDSDKQGLDDPVLCEQSQSLSGVIASLERWPQTARKIRKALADPKLSAPQLRGVLAEAQRLGCISVKGREWLQQNFKEHHGGNDFPGVPECVDC